MKVLVTGGTGFIGEHLVQYLVQQNYTVLVLYRSKEKLKRTGNKKIIPVKGDITKYRSLEKAMDGCAYVFHLAAYAKVWARDKETYKNINYTGTKNVLDAALKTGVKKVIITSTAGVFGPSLNHSPVNEETSRRVNYFSDYERTKDLADTLVAREYADKLDVCMVCPTRVYGPGALSESNSVTKLVKMYVERKFMFLPGNGRSIGNYVFIEDVVNGLLLALDKGKSGERYILGGENVSFIEFFNILAAETGKKIPLIKVPTCLMIAIASFFKAFAVLFAFSPLITPGWARKYLHNWIVSSNKATRQLGYKPTSLRNGIKLTVNWLSGSGDGSAQGLNHLQNKHLS